MAKQMVHCNSVKNIIINGTKWDTQVMNYMYHFPSSEFYFCHILPVNPLITIGM